MLARLSVPGAWALDVLRTEGDDPVSGPFSEYVGARFTGWVTVLAVNALDVPEPSTLALASVGLVLLARRRAHI